jgi:hypothetical protein
MTIGGEGKVEAGLRRLGGGGFVTDEATDGALDEEKEAFMMIQHEAVKNSLCKGRRIQKNSNSSEEGVVVADLVVRTKNVDGLDSERYDADFLS